MAFFYTYTDEQKHFLKDTTPALRATPPREGNKEHRGRIR
jgi:hypothetical protein